MQKGQFQLAVSLLAIPIHNIGPMSSAEDKEYIEESQDPHYFFGETQDQGNFANIESNNKDNTPGQDI
jgi:hypothetical protein